MVGQEPLCRVRKKHTRSRTGCLTCRERHVRCDEKRPLCANCTNGALTCEYAPFGQHFRDRATKARLPGVVAPWQAGPQAPLGSADPFDSLPIQMPFKSLDLLQYFTQTRALVADVVPIQQWRHSLELAQYDSVSCHSIVLLAGLHFAGSAGGLQSFESTYLHHKIQCINVVNKWLRIPDLRATTRCMRLVANLCLSETCMGNLAAAEHHLAGLLTLLELYAEKCKTDINDGQLHDGEVERYILMAQSLTISVRARIERAAAEKACAASLPKNEHDPLGHKERMDALRLTPYFFSNAAKVNPLSIDAGPAVDSLRVITSAFNQSVGETGGIPPRAWSPGTLSSMILTYTRLHVERLYDSKETRLNDSAKLTSTWGGIAVASSFYLYGVLGVRKAGMPIESRLLSCIFGMLSKDLDITANALAMCKCDSDFWLWKAFSASFAAAKLERRASEVDHQQEARRIKNVAYQRVREWSKSTEVSGWAIVRATLHRIVWPENSADAEARTIWEEAMKVSN